MSEKIKVLVNDQLKKLGTDDARLEQLCDMWDDLISTTNGLFSAYNWVKMLKTLVERNGIGALKFHAEREGHNPTLDECVNALVKSIEWAMRSNNDVKGKACPVILSLGGEPEATEECH